LLVSIVPSVPGTRKPAVDGVAKFAVLVSSVKFTPRLSGAKLGKVLRDSFSTIAGNCAV
jgi:hypothetical protein